MRDMVKPEWRTCSNICRSEEHTSELHHTVISYAVFCLKKKTRVGRSTAWRDGYRHRRGARRSLVGGVPQSGAGWLDFFFNDTATTEIYTLSLHDALPI